MGFSDFCNHSVFSETSEDILRYEGVHVFSEDECSKKYQTEVTEMKKIMLLLSKVTCIMAMALAVLSVNSTCGWHISRMSRNRLSMTEIHMKGKIAILLRDIFLDNFLKGTVRLCWSCFHSLC